MIAEFKIHGDSFKNYYRVILKPIFNDLKLLKLLYCKIISFFNFPPKVLWNLVKSILYENHLKN